MKGSVMDFVATLFPAKPGPVEKQEREIRFEEPMFWRAPSNSAVPLVHVLGLRAET